MLHRISQLKQAAVNENVARNVHAKSHATSSAQPARLLGSQRTVLSQFPQRARQAQHLDPQVVQLNYVGTDLQQVTMKSK